MKVFNVDVDKLFCYGGVGGRFYGKGSFDDNYDDFQSFGRGEKEEQKIG